MIEVIVAGESLLLLAERAVFWPRAQTLLVADAHLGKAAAFRAAGVPLPGGTTTAGLDRLATLIERHATRRLVLLGDLVHARASFAPATVAAISAWRRRVSACAVVLVRGNHDRRAGDPPAECGIDCVAGPLVEPPFAFRHHPVETPDSYTLAGHVHPAVRLAGPGRQRLRLPCFVFGDRVGVLPAFGPFTGAADFTPRRDERVFAVADGAVVEVPPIIPGLPPARKAR
jgi:DNA ligase-associated metallophosphoesterase